MLRGCKAMSVQISVLSFFCSACSADDPTSTLSFQSAPPRNGWVSLLGLTAFLASFLHVEYDQSVITLYRDIMHTVAALEATMKEQQLSNERILSQLRINLQIVYDMLQVQPGLIRCRMCIHILTVDCRIQTSCCWLWASLLLKDTHADCLWLQIRLLSAHSISTCRSRFLLHLFLFLNSVTNCSNVLFTELDFRWYCPFSFCKWTSLGDSWLMSGWYVFAIHKFFFSDFFVDALHFAGVVNEQQHHHFESVNPNANTVQAGFPKPKRN